MLGAAKDLRKQRQDNEGNKWIHLKSNNKKYSTAGSAHIMPCRMALDLHTESVGIYALRRRKRMLHDVRVPARLSYGDHITAFWPRSIEDLRAIQFLHQWEGPAGPKTNMGWNHLSIPIHVFFWGQNKRLPRLRIWQELIYDQIRPFSLLFRMRIFNSFAVRWDTEQISMRLLGFYLVRRTFRLHTRLRWPQTQR